MKTAKQEVATTEPAYAYQGELELHDAFSEHVPRKIAQACGMPIVEVAYDFWSSDVEWYDPALDLGGIDDTTRRQLVDDFAGQQRQRNWWFTQPWAQYIRTGRLQEQYRFSVAVDEDERYGGGYADVDVFNFGEDLHPVQVREIGNSLLNFAGMRQITPISRTAIILVHPERILPHAYSAYGVAGARYDYNLDAISLSQSAIDRHARRHLPAQGVPTYPSALQTDLIHELGHAVDYTSNDRLSYYDLGWRDYDSTQDTPDNPSGTLVDRRAVFRPYGAASPQETAADLYAMLNSYPELVPYDISERFRVNMATGRDCDPARFYLRLPKDIISATIERFTGAEMQLPAIPIPRQFAVRGVVQSPSGR